MTTRLFSAFIESWEQVNTIDPSSLTDARLNAHWASQVIAAIGEALVPAEPDFSHTSMTWSQKDRALEGGVTRTGSCVGLRLAVLTLRVRSAGGREASAGLEGKTLAEALAWIVAELETIDGGPLAAAPVIPGYEMPEHAVSRGEAFGAPDVPRLEELARWYANAARLVQLVSDNTLGASSVRCWPHHFDIASLVTLDPPGSDPETARSIGFGLSPGDTSYAEPYFYINPWPFPEQRDGHGPLAGGGHWHTEGWFGAVLPAGAIVGARREQAEQVIAWATSAMAAGRIILGTL